MNAKTLKALEGSIEKWRLIAYEGGVDKGADNCPLCTLYIRGERWSCSGCPVALRVSKTGCDGTPYIVWAQHRLRWHSFILGSIVTCPTCKTHAVAELKFLRSLRPRKRKKKDA